MKRRAQLPFAFQAKGATYEFGYAKLICDRRRAASCTSCLRHAAR